MPGETVIILQQKSKAFFYIPLKQIYLKPNNSLQLNAYNHKTKFDIEVNKITTIVLLNLNFL